MTYRSQIAIIGGRGIDSEAQTLVENISKMLVEEGFRIVTGGLGALPSAAHRGAKSASNSTGSDTIAILPGFDPRPALDHADIIIPTVVMIAIVEHNKRRDLIMFSTLSLALNEKSTLR